MCACFKNILLGGRGTVVARSERSFPSSHVLLLWCSSLIESLTGIATITIRGSTQITSQGQSWGKYIEGGIRGEAVSVRWVLGRLHRFQGRFRAKVEIRGIAVQPRSWDRFQGWFRGKFIIGSRILVAASLDFGAYFGINTNSGRLHRSLVKFRAKVEIRGTVVITKELRPISRLIQGQIYHWESDNRDSFLGFKSLNRSWDHSSGKTEIRDKVVPGS